jgi:ubiquinone/menaquinone biosynthesis C-methylase UbiE
MFKLEKYYKEGFDPKRYWEEKYSQEHIVGRSSDGFRKQGFWPLMEKHIERGKKYLDVGCGVGGWILFLKEEGYDVEGIDGVARVVRAMTEYDPDIVVKIAEATAIPYSDESLDGVLAIGALEYVENRVPKALKEVHRVLKNEGIFFIEVPIASLIRRLIYIPLKMAEKVVRRGQVSTFSNYLFGRTELKQMLKTAGFEVVDEQPHELPGKDEHYGLHVDWPIFRGKEPYKLNLLGRIVKTIANSISPWVASTGVVLVARKTR